MKAKPQDFWNERYNAKEYIYGIAPNQFFKQQLDQLKTGHILLAAEGEGRNAVYAAKQSWEVTAFDISNSGKEKALQLAAKEKVKFTYEVSDVLNFKTDKQFDAIGLIYAHFPEDIRKEANQRLLQFLKPGGVVIFEGFAKAQLGKSSGGPKNAAMLFSIEEIKTFFSQLEFKMLKEVTIELSEGNHHKGRAEVIRFVGVKS